MSVAAAGWIWLALASYAALGVLVAAALLIGALRRVDAKAAAAPLRVRLLFVPGFVALWPLMVRRLLGWRPEEDRR